MTVASDPIRTRSSLISRIKDPEDRRSWQEFYDTYSRLIRNTVVRAGIPAPEAEDVVQDTLVCVARNIGKFKTDPAFGSFKNWLFTLTRSRIEDRRRKLHRVPMVLADFQGVEVPTTIGGTSIEHRIPESRSGPDEQLDQTWEEEWRRGVSERALEKLKRVVEDRQFQVFFLYFINETPVTAVASSLGVSIAQVYLVKHRVLPKYKQALRESAAEAANPKVPPRLP